jgi:DDE superfamily endonuclease
MPPKPIEDLGPAFAEDLKRFLFCCDYTPTFDLLGVSCRGLLSERQRKTCEPIALAAGVAVRTPQQFLKDHLWSFARARTTLPEHVAATLPGLPADDLGSAGLHDETGTAMSGRCTPGVHRRHGGERGQLANGLVTAPTGICLGRSKTRFDADPFLPRSWDAARDRCKKAGIPDDIVYRPPRQIALAPLARAGANGIRFDWLSFDEGDGDKPGCLPGLASRQQRDVGEVPPSFRCFGRPPRPDTSEVIGDHPRRSRAARESRQRRQASPPAEYRRAGPGPKRRRRRRRRHQRQRNRSPQRCTMNHALPPGRRAARPRPGARPARRGRSATRA